MSPQKQIQIQKQMHINRSDSDRALKSILDLEKRKPAPTTTPEPRRRPRGTFRAEIYVDGKQQRRTFKTLEEAQGSINRVKVAQERRSVPLTMTELVEAREALDMLPDGVGLREVVRQWVRGQNKVHPVRAYLSVSCEGKIVRDSKF